jgi:hypothetical protein
MIYNKLKLMKMNKYLLVLIMRIDSLLIINKNILKINILLFLMNFLIILLKIFINLIIYIF